MSLSKAFGTNPDLETAGVVVVLGQAKNEAGQPVDTSIIVRRSGGANTAFQAELRKLSKPYQRQFQLGTVSAEVSERIYRDAFVNEVIAGWNNVEMSDVTGIATDTGFAEFSRENVTKLITNLPKVYEILRETADNHASFQDEAREEDAKN